MTRWPEMQPTSAFIGHPQGAPFDDLEAFSLNVRDNLACEWIHVRHD